MELKIKCVNTTTSSDGSQYGKFVIEPLEKGFGTTIGNSLRRVLLSSLEGTAVTSARIEGITHEYTAIPGVLEDVIDVMLNLKGLVVKTDSPEPQHLRIDVDKPGAVLACDIQLPAGVKVVNPDWLICTVAEGGSFHADIIVETGKGYEFVDAIKGGVVPREYIPAVDKGLQDAITSGVLAGYPVVDIKFTLFDGSYHDVDSNENAFRMAASMAFKEGMRKANPTLLEPMMAVEVETPEEYMGNVMGDLSSRRGIVQGMEDQVGGIKVIKAEVPLSEMFGYATQLRSLSQGRAIYSMEFKHYAEAPKNVADAVINKK